MKNCRISFLFLLVTLTIFYSCQMRSKYHDLVITNANIIDVKTGDILINQTVAIDSNRISAIYSKKLRFDNRTQIIDVNGKYVIPGLWDMHAHYYDLHNEIDPVLIANGITGVREMFGDIDKVNGIRDSIEMGLLHAPDIYSSGRIIDGENPSWETSAVVFTKEQAEKETIQQIKNGVDFIKIYDGLNQESFEAVLQTAKNNNIPVAGHMPDAISVWQVLNSGMTCLEHFDDQLIYTCVTVSDSLIYADWPNSTIYGFDNQIFDSLCFEFAKSNTWFCPTLTVEKTMGLLEDSSHINDPRLTYFSQNVTGLWTKIEELYGIDWLTGDVLLGLQKIYDLKEQQIKHMHDAGIKFLAGTDFPNPYCFPGFSLHDELKLLVGAGLPELEALKAATINGAIFMGREKDFGSIEIGKIASLVVLEKNPLEDIANTRKIENVILRGNIYGKEKLNDMLEKAKSLASNEP